MSKLNGKGSDEKYGLSDEVRLFTRGLSRGHSDLATEIKKQIANLTLEQRMDYSSDEYTALIEFQTSLGEGHYVLAEDFIRDHLTKHPGSVLLNLYYAKFLKEIKRKTEDAIARLEDIRVASGNDPLVLRFLMAYYVSLEFPNFEQAHSYAARTERPRPCQRISLNRNLRKSHRPSSLMIVPLQVKAPIGPSLR